MAKIRIQSKRKQDLIFYIVMLAYPVLQFLIFYVGVNFNSILMAFQYWSGSDGKIDNYTFFEGSKLLTNFITFFDRFDESSGIAEVTLMGGYAFKNAFVAYFSALIITTPVSLIFSYYIFKKFPLSGMMKVVLFAPSVICGMALVTIYTQFVEVIIPEIIPNLEYGLLANPDTKFNTVLFFCIWLGFGGGILLYVGAMNNISDSVIEACKLDGANTFQEIWYIVLPLIYPTFVTFIVVGVGGIFTNQMALYSFFGEGKGITPDLQTFGYWFFVKTKSARADQYPELAAIGLLMTAIVAPATLFVKWGLEKLGPKQL